MELEEEKILEFYKAKRSALLMELDVIQLVISNIEYRVATKNLPDKDKWQAELDRVYDSEPPFGMTYSTTSPNLNIYNKSMTYSEKILFALNKKSPSTVYEIINTLSKYETPENEDRFFQGITLAASNLNTKGTIESYRVGKRNNYSLKLTDTEKWKSKSAELADDEGEI